MSRLVIVVEKASDWGSYYPSDNVVPAMDYLREPIGGVVRCGGAVLDYHGAQKLLSTAAQRVCSPRRRCAVQGWMAGASGRSAERELC